MNTRCRLLTQPSSRRRCFFNWSCPRYLNYVDVGSRRCSRGCAQSINKCNYTTFALFLSWWQVKRPLIHSRANNAKGAALLLVIEKDAMTDASFKMTSKGFSVDGVIADGELTGVISGGISPHYLKRYRYEWLISG